MRTKNILIPKLIQPVFSWTGDKWKERLEQMMNQTQEKDILRFLKHTVLPAMRELRQELIGKYDLSVQINTLFETR